MACYRIPSYEALSRVHIGGEGGMIVVLTPTQLLTLPPGSDQASEAFCSLDPASKEPCIFIQPGVQVSLTPLS